MEAVLIYRMKIRFGKENLSMILVSMVASETKYPRG